MKTLPIAVTDAAALLNQHFTANHQIGYLKLFTEERLKPNLINLNHLIAV